MDNKLVICIVIFALTLLSYIINKIPMWVTALLSLAALYITGCVDANGALGGFANVNTILMGACFMVASGFRRTSLVKIMCDWLLKLTNGSFMKVYFGYLLLGVLLTNFMGSPMVVYAIIGPLLCALCDRTGNSRSKYIFPLMVIVVACCFALPLPTSIQKAGEFNGYLETYQFTGLEFAPLDFFFARFPVIILCLVWAMTIGPKMCPSKAAVELAAAEEQKDISSKLSPMVDKIGMVIFVVTMIGLIFSTQLHIASWWIALAGSVLMAMFGVVDQKKALAEIPWEMLILYAGALALGNGLVNTGAGDAIGGWLATGSRWYPQQLPLRRFILRHSVLHDPVHAEPFRAGSICSDLSSDLPVLRGSPDGTCYVRGICMPDCIYDTDGDTGSSNVYGRRRI